MLRRALRFATRPRVAVLPVLAIALACGATTPNRPCTAIAFADGVAAEWAQATAVLDFAPTRPCARDDRLRIARVFVDRMPADGGGFVPRLNQTVVRGGEERFVFSETRARVPFFAIPNGTRSLLVDLDGAPEPARGFVGTSPSGSAIAYVRWRAGEVTHELAAMLSPAFTEADLVQLVRDTAGAR